MQVYLRFRPRLERGALESAVMAGRVKMKLLVIWYVGTKAWQKECRETGSHICRSAGGGHRGPQDLFVGSSG